MSRLARIHRKKKAVAPIEDQDYEQDPRARLQRPPDMDDLAWKRLLEELYPDKKYLDYAKGTWVLCGRGVLQQGGNGHAVY